MGSKLAHNTRILLSLFLPLLFSALPAIADKTGIKIGLILPLSGDLAFLGEGIRNGALLAAEDLQEDGTTVEILAEDGRGSVRDSISAFTKLAEHDSSQAVISIISGVGKAINPLAERTKIIHVGICSDPDVARGEFNFLNYLTADQGVAAYLKELHRRGQAERPLYVFAADETGFRTILAQIDTAKERNLHAEIFTPGTNDFRSLLTRTRVTSPGIALILGLSPEIDSLAKQIRELHIPLELTSIESFGLSEQKGNFEGGWYVDSSVPGEEFQQRYRKRFNREVTPGVGHAYDSVLLIARGFQGTDNPRDPANAVRTILQSHGAIGANGALTVDREGIISSPPAIKEIKNGEVIVVR